MKLAARLDIAAGVAHLRVMASILSARGAPRDGDFVCPERARPFVLAAAILGSAMAFIDGTVLNVALPSIQRSLGASVGELQWILNAYMLLLGALLLIGGAAGDRFGRKRVFVLGTALFALASAACGLAPDPASLILARAVQGIGGALLVPGSLALISANFPREVRGRAVGIWSGAAAVTTAAGPLLGGWLIDAVSWRAIFFLNLPLAALTIGLALGFVPESRGRDDDEPLDYPGAALAAAGFGLLTWAFVAAGEAGFRTTVFAGIAAGTVMLGLFLWREARATTPMMPLRLFRSSTFAGANLLTLLLYFALSGILFLLPFNLIQVQGYSALEAGASFLPFTVIMGLFSRAAGRLVERIGPRLPLMLGPLVAGGGVALLAIAGTGPSYWTSFFPAMVLLGIGMTLAVGPLTVAVLNSAPDDDGGTASGINNAASRIAGLLAVAVLGAVALGLYRPALDDRLARLDLPQQVDAEVRDAVRGFAGIDLPDGLDDETTADLRLAVEEAFVHAFRIVTLAAAAAAAASALFAFFMIRNEDCVREE